MRDMILIMAGLAAGISLAGFLVVLHDEGWCPFDNSSE